MMVRACDSIQRHARMQMMDYAANVAAAFVSAGLPVSPATRQPRLSPLTLTPAGWWGAIEIVALRLEAHTLVAETLREMDTHVGARLPPTPPRRQP